MSREGFSPKCGAPLFPMPRREGEESATNVRTYGTSSSEPVKAFDRRYKMQICVGRNK